MSGTAKNIPPGPYRWTVNGLKDREGDIVMTPGYGVRLNQEKAANLEAMIEMLPSYVEEAEEYRQTSGVYLAMIMAILSRGCQFCSKEEQAMGYNCRIRATVRGDPVCAVCELQDLFDKYQKESTWTKEKTSES